MIKSNGEETGKCCGDYGEVKGFLFVPSLDGIMSEKIRRHKISKTLERVSIPKETADSIAKSTIELLPYRKNGGLSGVAAITVDKIKEI